MNENSFACKILKDSGCTIQAGGTQILNQIYTVEHPELITKITKNSDFMREVIPEDLKSITDIEALNDLGFKIIKTKVKGENFSYQRVGYKLVKNHAPVPDSLVTSNVPKVHKVQHDIKNQAVRLVGKNVVSPLTTGFGPWISIKEAYFGDQEYRRNPMISSYSQLRAAKKFQRKSRQEPPDSYFLIPEGVIGLTEDGHICTMPKPRQMDMPSIVSYGKKGQGKTIMENNGEDFFYGKFGIPCCNINDIKPESQTRCRIWDPCDFLDQLIRMGEPTTPKPAVYLHPTLNKYYQHVHMGEVGFDISLSFRELLKDPNLLIFNPQWQMNKTMLEWTNLIWKGGELRKDQLSLLNAKSFDDAIQLVNIQVTEQGMKNKIKRVLTDIFNTRMIDKSSGVPAKWVLKSNKGSIAESPWNICMVAGLFPYIITTGIRNQVWFPLWLRFVINDIIDFAKAHSEFSAMLFLDEVAPLLKEKATKEIIEQTIRECRVAGIGTWMVSHFFGDVPDSISMHTDYEFVFNTTDEDLITHLRKQRGLSKQQATEIPKLKQFECFAFGDFRLYDTDGQSFSNDGKPVKIVKIKPPNCRHYGG